MASEVEGEAEDFQTDPASLLIQQQRLDVLNRLLQKYQVKEIATLIEIRNDLDDQIAQYTNLDQALSDALAALGESEKLASKAAKSLSENRKQVLDSILKQLTESLSALGIPNPLSGLPPVVSYADSCFRSSIS